MKNFDINNIQLKLQSPDVTLDRKLENYITGQIEKMGKVFSRIKKCELLLKDEKDDRQQHCFVEAKIFMPRGVLFSQEHENNFHLAAKKVFEDLYEQLLKQKEKMDARI